MLICKECSNDLHDNAKKCPCGWEVEKTEELRAAVSASRCEHEENGRRCWYPGVAEVGKGENIKNVCTQHKYAAYVYSHVDRNLCAWIIDNSEKGLRAYDPSRTEIEYRIYLDNLKRRSAA